MLSLYTMYRHPERSYPKTIEGKLEALDFDLVLNSPLSFQAFYDFINSQSSYNKPYLDLYLHSKLYQEQIDMIMADFNSPTFERDAEELERLKEKILSIVTTYQRSHFNFDNLLKRTLARQSQQFSQGLGMSAASPRFPFGGLAASNSQSVTFPNGVNETVSAGG